MGLDDRDSAIWVSWLLGGGLRGDDLRELLAISRVVHARTGQTMLRAEDDRAILLVKGAAKAHVPTRDGDEVITAILGPGDTSGLLTALGHPEVGADLTALEPADGLVIAGPALRTLVAARPEITAACLRTIGRQHANAHGERLRFAGTCISQRVALRLLELAERWGRGNGTRVEVTLPLTQEELAAWSGASRESVAKVLQGLRATGLITTGRRSLTILDLPRLRARCERPEADQVRVMLEALT